MKRVRAHKVTIRVTFDAPLSAFEARHTVWNHFHGHKLYGEGKQLRGEPRSLEPYGEGTVHANKAPRVMSTKLGRPKKKAAPSVERDPNTIDMFEGLQQ